VCSDVEAVFDEFEFAAYSFIDEHLDRVRDLVFSSWAWLEGRAEFEDVFWEFVDAKVREVGWRVLALLDDSCDFLAFCFDNAKSSCIADLADGENARGGIFFYAGDELCWEDGIACDNEEFAIDVGCCCEYCIAGSFHLFLLRIM